MKTYLGRCWGLRQGVHGSVGTAGQAVGRGRGAGGSKVHGATTPMNLCCQYARRPHSYVRVINLTYRYFTRNFRGGGLAGRAAAASGILPGRVLLGWQVAAAFFGAEVPGGSHQCHRNCRHQRIAFISNRICLPPPRP